MTHAKNVEEAVRDAREQVARALGPAVLLTIEGMGFAIVPRGHVAIVQKVAERLDVPPGESR